MNRLIRSAGAIMETAMRTPLTMPNSGLRYPLRPNAHNCISYILENVHLLVLNYCNCCTGRRAQRWIMHSTFRPTTRYHAWRWRRNPLTMSNTGLRYSQCPDAHNFISYSLENVRLSILNYSKCCTRQKSSKMA